MPSTRTPDSGKGFGRWIWKTAPMVKKPLAARVCIIANCLAGVMLPLHFRELV